MKAIQVLVVSMFMVLAGTPVAVLAQQAPEVFALPNGVAGGSYQTNIQGVLRDKYKLKLESNVGESIFRWSFAGGEMPPGLVVRPTGTIAGTPRLSRDEPYRFQVKVVDLVFSGSEALSIDLMLTIAAHRIRLSQVRTPRLTPLNTVTITANQKASTGQANHSADTLAIVNDEMVETYSAFLRPASNPTTSWVAAPSAGPASADLNPPTMAASSRSREPIPDTSYNADLIRPVLNTLRAKLPEPIAAFNWKGNKKVTFDPAKEKASGDKIRGPAKIELKNLNVLRYDIKVGKDVTFPAAPDLKLPFIPPIPNQPEQLTGVTAFVASNDAIDDRFRQLLTQLDPIEEEKRDQVNAKIVTAISTTNVARNHLEALVTASDSILTTDGGPGAILAELPTLTGTVAGPAGEIDLALNNVWPDAKIENLLGRLDTLRNGLLTLPTTPLSASDTTWDNWYKGGNKAGYDFLVTRVGELQTQLIGLKSNSTQGVAFQDAQNKLRRWKPILVGVRDSGVAGFNRQFEVGCGFAFNTGKETKVNLIKRDRLADPGAALVEEEIVTVVCSSPISVSAGFGFSNIDEKEFVFVPSTKSVTANGQTTQTVINRFGLKNKSAFRTLPVLLLNTRVWEPNDTVALHLSTGAAVDVKTGQGGTDLEYIVGPSISFWRTLFITPGLHIGRVPKLAGGFELDQEVPTGIAEPPIEKAWKKGFVTTFTYKIK